MKLTVTQSTKTPVVPGKMAIVGFAPRLDQFGNSVRAQEAIRYISEQLDLSIFGSSE